MRHLVVRSLPLVKQLTGPVKLRCFSTLMSWPPSDEKVQEEVAKILAKHAEAKGKGKGAGKSAADFPAGVALTMYAAHLLVRAAGGDAGAETFEAPTQAPFMDDEVKGALAHLEAQMRDKP